MTDPRELDMTMPTSLRRAIARDLRPVVPLASPLARAVWLIPFGLVLLVAAAALFGVRRDAPRLGLALTWLASGFETAVGLAVFVAALREAVPGTLLSRRVLLSAFGASVLIVGAITWTTWSVSPTTIFRDPHWFIWRVCVGGTIASALPPLIVSAWLVSRAFPLRPAVAGALSGLGAGLMADAGWRIFCHFSDPAHVFATHGLGIAATIALGAMLVPALLRRKDHS